MPTEINLSPEELHNSNEPAKIQVTKKVRLTIITILVVVVLVPTGLTTYSYARSRRLIKSVEEFHARRKYEECIATATKKLEIQMSLQTSKKIEYFQDRCRISLAREIVNTEKKYEAAIEILQNITRDRELHGEAEELIDNYFLFFKDF